MQASSIRGRNCERAFWLEESVFNSLSAEVLFDNVCALSKGRFDISTLIGTGA
jgi:hypothetical protein